MVSASKGCKGCRTRRIKCDKKTPECSQCIRAKKPCSGYRDPLSLMFRDESTKVMEKAKKQWGVGEGPSARAGGPSRISPSSSSSSSFSPLAAFPSASTSSVPPSSSSSSAVAVTERGARLACPNRLMPQEVGPTRADQAVHYYVQRFILGYPDEAKEGRALRQSGWVYSPIVRDAMAAVGLASMANLRGEKGLLVLARERYGAALKQVAKAMARPDITGMDLPLRAVVMLAIFESIRGNTRGTAGARTHLMGAAALIRAFMHKPMPAIDPSVGARGMVTLCLSMLASTHCSIQQSSLQPNVFVPGAVEYAAGEEAAGDPLPQAFFDIVQLGHAATPPEDRAAPELLLVMMRVVQLAAFARRPADDLGPLVDDDDDNARTRALVADVLAADAQLAAWEWRYASDPVWGVREERFPPDMHVAPEAAFDRRYHVYNDMYFARTWNHYRLARITTAQMIVEAAERFPVSFQAAVASSSSIATEKPIPAGSVSVAANDAATVTATATFDPPFDPPFDSGPAVSASDAAGSSSPAESPSTYETNSSSSSPPPLRHPPTIPFPSSLPQPAFLPSQASTLRRQAAQAELQRIGRDLLVSVPTHLRHPLMTAAQRALVDRTSGPEGIGAAAIATTLFQLKLAACAPGAPRRVWAWAVDTMHMVWSETGMLQARALADWARKHREELDRREAAGRATAAPAAAAEEGGIGPEVGVARQGQLGQQQQELGGGGGGGLSTPRMMSPGDGTGAVL